MRAEGLSEHYGSTVALDALDPVVEAGRVVGFLGPNGAGKSTTIRLLLGLARPTAGRAWVFGIPAEDVVRAHRLLAHVPADVAPCSPQLTGAEMLELLGRTGPGWTPRTGPDWSNGSGSISPSPRGPTRVERGPAGRRPRRRGGSWRGGGAEQDELVPEAPGGAVRPGHLPQGRPGRGRGRRPALDRLCRTARDRLALIEAFDAGAMIARVRGSDMDPTTPAGRLVLGIPGEVAQHEIDQKSDRRGARLTAAGGEVPPATEAGPRPIDSSAFPIHAARSGT